MKARKGRYYVGRVVKGGRLTQDSFLSAIKTPAVLSIGKYKWTIVGIVEGNVDGSPFIFGNLAKYEGTGEVPVIRENEREAHVIDVQDLMISKSPFIYFKEFSGIAYLHVWNSIEDRTFKSRFSRIVREKFDDFFVDCAIEPISDIKTFAEKILGLTAITDIRAKVSPPNPLFGRCWKSLNDYINERNASTIRVREESLAGSEGLRSRVKDFVKAISINKIDELDEVPSLTDAAILMATDGYGNGQVIGRNAAGAEIVVRTLDAQISFLFDKEPSVESLAEHVYNIFKEIVRERKMSHAKH